MGADPGDHPPTPEVARVVARGGLEDRRLLCGSHARGELEAVSRGLPSGGWSPAAVLWAASRASVARGGGVPPCRVGRQGEVATNLLDGPSVASRWH